jgi:hypothetical protein
MVRLKLIDAVTTKSANRCRCADRTSGVTPSIVCVLASQVLALTGAGALTVGGIKKGFQRTHALLGSVWLDQHSF